MYGNAAGKEALVGKKIIKIEIADDKEAFRIYVEGDSEPILFATDGDCCSHTWIEHFEGIAYLIGGTVVNVEDVDSGADDEDSEEDKYGNVIRFYGWKVTTDKGHAMLDYRNESNGYYGGSLWCNRDSGYNSYYGGVHGQNKSDEKWVELTADF